MYLALFTVPSVKSNKSIFMDSRGGPHGLYRYPHHVYGVYLAPWVLSSTCHVSVTGIVSGLYHKSGVNQKYVNILVQNSRVHGYQSFL